MYYTPQKKDVFRACKCRQYFWHEGVKVLNNMMAFSLVLKRLVTYNYNNPITL